MQTGGRQLGWDEEETVDPRVEAVYGSEFTIESHNYECNLLNGAEYILRLFAWVDHIAVWSGVTAGVQIVPFLGRVCEIACVEGMVVRGEGWRRADWLTGGEILRRW